VFESNERRKHPLRWGKFADTGLMPCGPRIASIAPFDMAKARGGCGDDTGSSWGLCDASVTPTQGTSDGSTPAQRSGSWLER
jgi:hypothetical protein